MACGLHAPDPSPPRARVARVFLLFVGPLLSAVAAAVDASNATMSASPAPSASGAADNMSADANANATTAAGLLASTSDLTALFYRHYNSGVIVPPIANASVPPEVTQRLAPYELRFDELDGFLQRALLWDAGYIYSSANAAANARRRLANATASKSPFIRIYTRAGVDMASIAPTRSEMESAGCSLQLCTSDKYGSTWRAVECANNDAILATVHCAIDPRDAPQNSVEGPASDGRPRSVWTAWNPEDRASVQVPASTELAAPDVNVATYEWNPESREAGAAPVRLYTIHTVAFSDEPPIGQCPQSRTDDRGDLLPTLTIPCAPYDAPTTPVSTNFAKSSGSSSADSAVSTTVGQWQQPKSSQLLTTWLKSVAPSSDGGTPASATKKPSSPGSSPNNAGDNSIPSGVSPLNRSSSSDGFSLLNLIPIVVGVLALVAIAIGFVMFRRRRSNDGEDGDDHCPHNIRMKAADGYIDAGFLSPAAGPAFCSTTSGRSRTAMRDDAISSNDSEVPLAKDLRGFAAVDPEIARATSDRRPKTKPKAVVMASLRRVVSEPSSASTVSRPSLDTEHLKLLQTDPNLSASRLSYDKIVFERVISKSSRYEVWLAQYEGEEIAVKRLVKSPLARRVNSNDSDALSMSVDEAEMERMDNLVEAFVAEIQITASLDHPNLSRFVGVAWTRLPADSLCLVTEYQSNGNLRRYLQQHRDELLSWQHRRKVKWAKGIASALKYLHSQQPVVLHLELKSTHVLLSDRLHAKLIDFGERLSAEDWAQLRISGENHFAHQNQQLSFPYWAAPEVLRGEGHLSASDVYSFGMLLVELDSCKTPFSDAKNTSNGSKLKPFQMMNMVISGRLKPTLTATCPDSIKEIVERCTDSVPARRPAMNEVLRMLELAEYDLVS